jgi:hypothetical protein
MISFWISVVPPKMDRTLKIIGHALFNEGKATAPIARCSRSLGSPAAWSRVIGGAGGSWLGLWVLPCGLGGGFLSALVLLSAGGAWIACA